MDHRVSAPNVAELYRQAAEKWGPLPAFATRRRALQWVPVSFAELYRQGLCLATGLIELGVAAREPVGLLGDNRQEWILADYGLQLSGAVNVPRGGDVTDAEMIYIINHAGIRVVMVETAQLQNQLLRLRGAMPDLAEIILLDPQADSARGVIRLLDLVARGEELRAGGDRGAEERMEAILPDDLFTLIYTSGTTGPPKGVMLTHANMMFQVDTVPIPVGCTDRLLSILPVWHIFERVFEMLSIACGSCTYYTSIRTFAEDLRNVEPTFMGSAPRLWENLHDRILKNVRASHPVRRLLFHTAYFLAHYYKESVFTLRGLRLALAPVSGPQKVARLLGHGLRWAVLLPVYGFFNAAVLERVRQAAGGSLKATVSGGGALPMEIDRFFNYLGLPVLEGYGLTETAPVLAVRTEASLVVGTVGPPLEGTEIRIVDLDTRETLYPNPKVATRGRGQRGEIWVRGPQVMKGYYRDPETTNRTLLDGWLRTGDLGMITFNDCLKILGRCKETIVLVSGENLEPGPIEEKLRQSSLIEQCMVVGQDRRFIAALIVPQLDGLRELGWSEGEARDLPGNGRANQMVREEIRRIISAANGFKHFERVHDFRLLGQSFTVGEELTNLGKLKRHVVETKYGHLIREIFEPATGRGKARHGR